MTAEDAFECETKWPDDFPQWIAEDCAEDFHGNHDGWDSSWPLQLTVILESGEEITFEIDRESRPVFRASRIKEDHAKQVA